MKQPRLFINLIVIITLVFVISGLSVTSSVELAQAASAANIPSQQATDADLAITKTNGQTSTVPGTATTYTIVVTNNGPEAVLAAGVTDTFLADLTGVNWTCSNAGGGTCTNMSGSGSISETVDLPVGTSVTFSATGTVSASATGSLANTAAVSPPGGVTDPTPGNNSATDTDTLTPEANLAISKTDNQNSTVPGTATTYMIVVTNSGGPSNITGATVADTFLGTLTGVTWTCAGTGGGTCPASGSGNINNTINLPVGSSVTFTATGTVSASATGSLANTATVTLPGGASDPNTGNNTDTDTDTLTPQANLAISKTNNQTSTVPGTLTAYTIVVTNTGPSNAPGATVTDNFPGILTGVTWTCIGAGGGTCPASGSGDIGGTVNLPPGGSVTFSASGTVNADATGSLVNTASVSPPGGVTDPTPGNNSATDTDTLTPQANLAVTKTNNQTSTVPGTPTTYIITVTNSSGPSDITGATVADTFPSMSGVNWTCTESGSATCPANGSGNINATVSLPVGTSVTFTATGTVNPGATGSLVNTATVALPGGSSDPVPGNNSATDTDTLTPQADLSISKTNGVSSLIPGNNTTYTIIVSNSGPSSATGATVADTFPSMTGVTWTCAGTGGGTCPASGSGNINNTVNLPPGGSVTFSATGTVNPGARGSLVNTATVTAPAGVTELIPGNNSATDTDTLDAQANLRVLKTDSPDPVSAGSVLTYSMTIFNDGPSDATGVTLSDNLDNSSVTFLSSTPASPTCTLVGGDVGCNLGTIPSGSSTLVIIRVTVNASTPAGFVNNLNVHVEGNEADLIPINNDASASTTVQVRSDLSITKTDSPDPAALGAPFTYSLRVTNNGPSNATGVTVQDVLPGGAGGVNFVSANSTLGTCSQTTTVNCTLGNMVSGSVATVTIVVDPKATGTVNNTATVTSSSTDLTPGNDSSTATTTVNRVTDLAITNSDAPDPVTQGDDLTYTLGVINNGPSGATNVTVTSSLPAGVSFQSVTPGAPTCNHASSVITCNLGSIAKNGTATISVIVNVNPSTIGNISSTASVAVSGSTDPNSSNNSATANTFVNGIEKLYLPLLLKPPPTQLSIHNDNTGGNVTVTVQGTGVSCTVPNNTTLFCGSFPPGTYNVQVISPCGTATVPKFYDSGPQTTRVFCK